MDDDKVKEDKVKKDEKERINQVKAETKTEIKGEEVVIAGKKKSAKPGDKKSQKDKVDRYKDKFWLSRDDFESNPDLLFDR